MRTRRGTWLYLLFAAAPAAAAQDWPQWRGPARDGLASAFRPPAAWPAELKPLWKVTVGEGYSSPVVAADKAYVLSRQEEREVVSAIDLGNGALAWQQSYPAPYQMNPAATRHGKGPKSTPLVSGARLYTFGISSVLSCFDAASGELRWRKDFSREFRETTPLYGAAMSAVVDGGLLIAHLGGNDQGALTAFDAATGEVRWKWTGDGPGYASPIVVELSGVRQVVTQTQQNLVGVNAVSGALLWKIPFTTPYVQNVVTPVLHGDQLIFSGLEQGIMAVRLAKKGSDWTTEKIWESSTLSMYMSSPVLVGDLLFGLSHRNKGQFFCVDARSGATLWTSEPRQAENAALIAAGDLLLLLTDAGELIVARVSGKGFEPVKRYTVATSPTWAHPAVMGNRVLIKDNAVLTLWSLE